MRLFGPKFKPGDRVVYVGTDTFVKGWTGTVISGPRRDPEDKEYTCLVKYDETNRDYQGVIWGGNTYVSSMKLMGKVSAFEHSLIAYIAAEKLALGIS